MDYVQGYVKVPAIIEDIKRAQGAGAYFSAMAMAFGLIAECSRVEYPNIKNNRGNYKDREIFEKWCDVYLFKDDKEHDRTTCTKFLTSYMSGEILYQLRCSILHESTSEIDFEKVSAEDNKIDDFTLVFEEHNDYAMGGVSSSVSDSKYRTMSIDVDGLCSYICYIVDRYYRKNEDKFKVSKAYDFTKKYIEYPDWRNK